MKIVGSTQQGGGTKAAGNKGGVESEQRGRGCPDQKVVVI